MIRKWANTQIDNRSLQRQTNSDRDTWMERKTHGQQESGKDGKKIKQVNITEQSKDQDLDRQDRKNI